MPAFHGRAPTYLKFMYCVFKHQDAMVEVLAAWEHGDAELRVRIPAAMLDLEKQLQVNPLGIGESRGEGLRILFQYPLAVTFQVEEENRMVRILRAWTYRRLAA